MFSILVILIFMTFSEVFGLECYVCTDVEGNWGDCITRVQRCDPSQDACQSFVEYRTPGFWTVLRERRAFVTKGCTTKAACETARSNTVATCNPSRTRDWFCTHCCTEDRCNYQVPDNAGLKAPTLLTMFIVAIFIWKYFV
ncbi:hypothetical protein CSKR_202263 [Clonorchis sinensis]|uniref:UPAR/Ly6 domain-containing protein n=1 Tax=Clonorchis sinensis TaxID=79923 RepID=A0A8T1LYI3_CLOSI|nr:hypothetical protein CSKR_202263 [Clonorchis sinensis]